MHEVGRATGGKGPSAVLYELNPESGWVVGIDVGAPLGAGGAGRHHRHHRRPPRRARALAQLGRAGRPDRRDRARRGQPGRPALAPGDARHGRQLRACSIPSRGLLAHAPNLPGWGRQGLVGAIRDELGTAVSFENDVNLAALGERALGAGRDVGNFVFLWVGTGVGMGIVIDGELYRGAGGAAGEIGYMPVGRRRPRTTAGFRRRGHARGVDRRRRP